MEIISSTFVVISSPSFVLNKQARIHTGFHRFTEIGQIFHNKYIFNNEKHFPSWNLGNMLPEWLENPGKGT